MFVYNINKNILSRLYKNKKNSMAKKRVDEDDDFENDFENDNFYEIENNLYDQNKILLRSYKKSFRRLEDIDINGSIDITQ